MAWDESGERVTQFAHWLRAAAVALPETIPKKRLLDRFTHSLTGRLREHALAVQGTFDDVTSGEAMMSGTKVNTQKEIKFRSERIRAVVDSDRPS